jgi:aspartyl aminopeptidase
MACGSTIGPILASSLGCRTIDVGAPQLAMHSIREMCGTDDIAHSYNHFVAFFEEFTEISAILEDIDSLPPADIQGEIEDPSCQHVAGS